MLKIAEVEEMQPHFRRRAKLRGHTTAISNVVIYGYSHLSDAAKMTYIALESYDWPDENGQSKGKAWPSIGRLAQDRGKSYDSICRHLKELASAGLIGIESGKQQGRSNVYWLEEPAKEEVEMYHQRSHKSSVGTGRSLEHHTDSIESESNVSEAVDASTMFEPNLAQYRKRTGTFNSESCRYDKPQKTQDQYVDRIVDNFSIQCGGKDEVEQKCVTGSSNNAGEGSAFLPDKGIGIKEIKNKQEKEDSNRTKKIFPNSNKELNAIDFEQKTTNTEVRNASVKTVNVVSGFFSNSNDSGNFDLPTSGLNIDRVNSRDLSRRAKDLQLDITNQLGAGESSYQVARVPKIISGFKPSKNNGLVISGSLGLGANPPTDQKDCEERPPTPDKRSNFKRVAPVYITQVMQDFSLALNDNEHCRSNQSQVSKLYWEFKDKGFDEQKFVKTMYEAKKRAQWAALANGSTRGNGPNRAAYFFSVLRTLLSGNE